MKSVAKFLLLLGFVGCQHTPTRVLNQEQVRNKDLQEQISKDVVILDARPDFDYNMAHIPGAVSIQWREFSQKTEPYLGLLERDLFIHARRLARLGIGPDTPVYVVGRGQSGEGEEGRLAWTLKVMGVKNVEFFAVDHFTQPLTKQDTPVRESVPMWKPEFDDSLVMDRTMFLRLLTTARHTPESPLVIDVRTEKEYLGKHKGYYSKKAPDISAINIPWQQFIDSQGMPNGAIKEQLRAVGITENRLIVVIDDIGVRSALVTLALRKLGFDKATNFAGGYMYLLGQK